MPKFLVNAHVIVVKRLLCGEYALRSRSPVNPSLA